LCWRHIHEDELNIIADEEINVLDACIDGVDPSPFQFTETCPLSQALFLFLMLKVRRAFVTRFGVLIGVITKASLIDAIESASKSS
jgi:hypothetical protein